MTAYYNEIEPYAADWLENLIREKLIAPGIVDRRSIVDVRPADLDGFVQCHFFAGIGGWSYALRLAGWADTRPVWSGSPPRQPFSVAGKQTGFADDRHLWPRFERLVAKRRPAVVFGEQSSAASVWLNLVRGDLEALGYAVGAIPMEAASADAEHFRDRYWLVAHLPGDGGREGQQNALDCGDASVVADAASYLGRDVPYGHDAERRPDDPSGHHNGGQATERNESTSDLAERCAGDVVDDTSVRWGEGWTEHEFRSRGFTAAVASVLGRHYVECPDGKWRRLPPPRVRWLGTRVPSRVAKLRAIGNAIDHRPAKVFIESFMECRP